MCRRWAEDGLKMCRKWVEDGLMGRSGVEDGLKKMGTRWA